jgi:hypothetical protein
LRQKGIFFDLTPTFYGGFILKITEPSIVMSAGMRADDADSASQRARGQAAIAEVAKAAVSAPRDAIRE